MMRRRRAQNIKLGLYGVLSSLMLFLGFFANHWRVADPEWFRKHNYDMESFVVGRIVQSRQDGIFSNGGLTGLGSPDATPAEFGQEAFAFQYAAYMNGLTFESFSTYKSQIGGQGMLFSVLDELIRLSAQGKLQVFHALTSLLSALTITAIVLWFHLEFGLSVSLFVLGSAILSPWLAVFGGKLWWSMWSFYLPLAVIMYYLRNRNPTSRWRITVGVLVFMSIFVKCVFTGYEYITTTLIMMMAPFVYYHMLGRSSFRELIGGSLTAVFGSCLAILLSFAILCIQIASVEGSLSKGLDHIAYVVEKRTYADPRDFPAVYSASLESDTATVVLAYLAGSYFGPAGYLRTSNPLVSRLVPSVRYGYLILVFGAASVFLYALRNRYRDKEKAKRSVALLSATWFSLAAPLSWFVIFKAHSFIHRHMNYIVWQMPFTLLGFAVCGLVLQAMLTGRRYWIYAD